MLVMLFVMILALVLMLVLLLVLLLNLCGVDVGDYFGAGVSIDICLGMVLV